MRGEADEQHPDVSHPESGDRDESIPAKLETDDQCRPPGQEKIPAFNALRCEQNLKEPETPCQLSTHKVQNIKWLEYDRATGYYAFASATATVQITEYDSKKREEIGAALSAAYTGYGTTVGGSAGFSALVGTEVAGKHVTKYIATNGVTSDPPNDSIEALGDYIFHLSNFTDPKANRHKVILSPYSDCKSYQEALMLVPDGGDFPQVPTVTDDIFTLCYGDDAAGFARKQRAADAGVIEAAVAALQAHPQLAVCRRMAAGRREQCNSSISLGWGEHLNNVEDFNQQ